MERLFTGARWLTNHSRQAHVVRDMVVWIGGDTVSGIIHEDLRETNAMGLPESIAFAQQIMSDGLNYLLKNELIFSAEKIVEITKSKIVVFDNTARAKGKAEPEPAA